VGLGTVQGTVRNPDGTLASGVSITLRKLKFPGGWLPDHNLQFRRRIHYQCRFRLVPSLDRQRSCATVGGGASGQIVADGSVAIVNIQLLNNAINLPTNLLTRVISSSTSRVMAPFLDGTNSVYGGDFGANRGAFFLDV